MYFRRKVFWSYGNRNSCVCCCDIVNMLKSERNLDVGLLLLCLSMTVQLMSTPRSFSFRSAHSEICCNVCIDIDKEEREIFVFDHLLVSENYIHHTTNIHSTILQSWAFLVVVVVVVIIRCLFTHDKAIACSYDTITTHFCYEKQINQLFEINCTNTYCPLVQHYHQTTQKL